MADQYSEKRLRQIMQEVLQGTVPGIVEGSVPDVVRDLTPVIKTIQVDLGQLKETVRGQSKQLNKLGELHADNSKEIYRLGVLFEDLDERFKTDSELLRNNLNVKDKVDNQEDRLVAVETTQLLMKKVVKQHSRQLKLVPS